MADRTVISVTPNLCRNKNYRGTEQTMCITRQQTKRAKKMRLNATHKRAGNPPRFSVLVLAQLKHVGQLVNFKLMESEAGRVETRFLDQYPGLDFLIVAGRSSSVLRLYSKVNQGHTIIVCYYDAAPKLACNLDKLARRQAQTMQLLAEYYSRVAKLM